MHLPGDVLQIYSVVCSAAGNRGPNGNSVVSLEAKAGACFGRLIHAVDQDEMASFSRHLMSVEKLLDRRAIQNVDVSFVTLVAIGKVCGQRGI